MVDALKRGRSFVTRLPDGVEVYLTGTGVDGQRQIMGGALYGAPTDPADFEILVRRAGGMRLTVIRDGAVATVVPITSDEQTVPFSTPVGSGGFVRVEVRGEPFFGGQAAPLASRTDMEAFSNPVFLEPGPPPVGTQPDPTQPPAQAGPRRGGGLGLPTVGAVGAVATVGAAAAVLRLSHSELRLRAATGDTLQGLDVLVTGEVTAVDEDSFRLTRWVPGCCSAEDALNVEVLLPGHAAQVGSWWEVEGRWVEGTGTGVGVPPAVVATVARTMANRPPRREDLG